MDNKIKEVQLIINRARACKSYKEHQREPSLTKKIQKVIDDLIRTQHPKQ